MVPRFDERPLRGTARLIIPMIYSEEATVDDFFKFGRGSPVDHWSVVLGEGGRPVAVLEPGKHERLMRWEQEPLGDVARGQDFLIADIDTTFRTVTGQVEALELAEQTPVVVVESGGIVGLSSVVQLNHDLFHVRLAGSALPGRPQVPQLVRCCKFHQANVGCTHPKQFQVKPAVMPPCPNPRGLTRHDFVW